MRQLARHPATHAVLALVLWWWLGTQQANLDARTMAVLALLGLSLAPWGTLRTRRQIARTLPAIAGMATVWLFVGPLRDGTLGHQSDWLINEAILREFVHALELGHDLPRVLNGIATGDPTRDLYPTLLHDGLAHLVLWTGIPLHDALVGAVLAFHTLAIVGVARVALRVASLEGAVLATTLALFETGGVFTWGLAQTWHFGLVPSTAGIALALFVAADVFDVAACAPGRGPSTRAVGGVAGAFALHPSAALLAAALIVALAVVGMGRRHRRGAVDALGVVIAGALLAGPIWLPMAARLPEHALLVGTAPRSWVRLAHMLGDTAILETAFPTVLRVACTLGLVLATRARASSWVVITVVVLVALDVDAVALETGLAPSPFSARLQSHRASGLALPWLLILGASTIGGTSPPRLPRRAAWTLSSLALLACLHVVSTEGDGIGLHIARRLAAIDATRLGQSPLGADFEALSAHLRERSHGFPTRVVFDGDGGLSELLMLRWSAGVEVVPNRLPTGIFHREQPYGVTSSADLDRYAIRFVVGRRGSRWLEEHGALCFGPYCVVERPHVTGLVHTLEGNVEGALAWMGVDEWAIDVRGSGTIELAIPYYARYVATLNGHRIPVLAHGRSADAFDQRTVALRVHDGRVVVRPTGRLPEDSRGDAAFALGLTLVAVRARRLWRTLRERIARVPGVALALGLAAIALGVAGFALGRQGAWGGPRTALRFGGWFGDAGVRVGSVTCPWDGAQQAFACPDGLVVRTSMGSPTRASGLGWGIPTPVIRIETKLAARVELRVPHRLRGEYLVATSPRCFAHLEGLDEPITHRTRSVELAWREEARLSVETRSRICDIGIVRRDSVEPPSWHGVPWWFSGAAHR